MRKVLLILGLAFMPLQLLAQQGIQNVHEVAITTSTITQTINVCNTVLDVAAATSSGTLAGAWAIEAFNIAASTVSINCGFDTSLSTNAYSAWYGREVPAGVGVYWAVPVVRKLRCLSQNPGGCTRVTITQFK